MILTAISFFLLLEAATLVNAHGYFVSPVGRQPGTAFSAACGQQASNMMSSDINGNIQGLRQLTFNQADFNAEECNLWLCKVRDLSPLPSVAFTMWLI